MRKLVQLRLAALILSVILAAAGTGGIAVVYAQNTADLRQLIEATANLQALTVRVAAIESAKLPERVAKIEGDVATLMTIDGAMGVSVLGMAAHWIFFLADSRDGRRRRDKNEEEE